MRITLDNTVLVLAVREAIQPNADAYARRARACLRHLMKEGHEFFVPAPVLAEYLVFVPPDRHEEVVREFRERFKFVSFDTDTAQRFAKVWWQRSGGRKLSNELRAGATKQEIKFDHQIVACALAVSSELILSEDKALRKFANGIVQVQRVGDIELPAEQISLLEVAADEAQTR